MSEQSEKTVQDIVNQAGELHRHIATLERLLTRSNADRDRLLKVLATIIDVRGRTGEELSTEMVAHLMKIPLQQVKDARAAIAIVRRETGE